MEIRQPIHSEQARSLDTEGLRRLQRRELALINIGGPARIKDHVPMTALR